VSRLNTRPSCEHYSKTIPTCGLHNANCDAVKCGRIGDEEKYDYEHELVADIMRYATKLGVYVERLGQRKAKGSGNERGAPDLLLYCSGQVVPIECKRFKDGKLELDQIAAIEKRSAQGVETIVVRRVDDFIEAINFARRPRGVQRREMIQSW
jgi:hypothetical protein